MANNPTDIPPAAPSGSKPGLSPHAPASARRWPPQPWWLVFLVLMTVNYVGTRVFLREASSIIVPYTFFKAQVDAGNVEDVTSVGDAIQGRFKTKVTYPPPKAGTPAGQPHSPDQPELARRRNSKRSARSSPTRTLSDGWQRRGWRSRPSTRARHPG